MEFGYGFRKDSEEAFVEVDQVHEEVVADEDSTSATQLCLYLIELSLELFEIEPDRIAIETACEADGVDLVQVSAHHAFH